MMGPVFLENRSALLFVTVTLFLFLTMDSYLWMAFRGSSGPLPVHLNSSGRGCTGENPFCVLDAKSLMLDWANFYVHNPLSAFIYWRVISGSVFEFITANGISITHIFIAAMGARLICNDSIYMRRLGVLLFEFRNFLDALDGTVARARKSHLSNLDNLNSSGYYIDGICDGFGCVFLLVGCFVYLRNHPVKKHVWYSPLPTTLKIKSEHKAKDGYPKAQNRWLLQMAHGVRTRACRSGQLPVWIGIQWLVNSTGWNRYITRFTYLFENPNVPLPLRQIQSDFVRRPLTCCALISWRLINVHANLELLLLAIFFDKLGEFLSVMYFLGWILILGAVVIGELVLHEAQSVFTF